MSFISTWTRLTLGMTVMAVGVVVWAVLMVVLLPSRYLRARACNVFGKTVLRAMVWLSGCPVTVEGSEHLDRNRPAIYVSNHTSIMDIFLTAWLTPHGTCGIAKKEVVWYPFFGQLYYLSGHFRIDRSSTERAVESMKRIGDLARKYKHSIMVWPEGRRARDGRLRPLKKGIVHLAIQTGLPVVPIVIENAHRSWASDGFRLERVPITVRVLPAIDTSDWTTEDLDTPRQELFEILADALPESQKPVTSKAAA